VSKLDDSQTAADWQEWLESHNLVAAFDLSEDIPKRERARRLYDVFDLKLEQKRLERDRALAAGASRVRIRRLEEQTDELDDAVSELFGLLNPILVNGQEFRPDERPCKSVGCGEWVTTRQAFEQGGHCRRCTDIKRGLADQPGPTELEEAVESVK
jgi:hypothetical protein